MDKNIAAFMRQDTKTVHVKFMRDRRAGESEGQTTLLGDNIELSPQTYTYITDLELAEGDFVVVHAVGVPKVARVESVDEGLELDPNDTIKYKWVVCKVDFSSYAQNIAKNNTITTMVAKAYKKNLRKQFSSLLLEGMDEVARQDLLSIIEEKVK